ncbi:MAG: aminotransferase class IV [Candidatus Omnitrophica bacterium]|nr:aminotransferase class IV [Candidatus Omnitrophota bacterium]
MNRVSPVCLFNGEILSLEELSFPQLARGFMYGDGVFETLRARNYVLFRWADHWERLVKGLASCHISFDRSKASVAEEIVRLLTKYNLADAYVRVNVWRKQPEFFDPGSQQSGHLLVYARPFQPYPEENYHRGIRCLVSQRFVKNENSPLTAVKSLNMLENILARIEARQQGYDEALLTNTRHYLAEGTTANIFFIRDGGVYTPALECGALAGITRKIVLELCRKKNLPVREGTFSPGYLHSASEVFLTNTLMGIMPVREIRNVFHGQSFPFARMLSAELSQLFLEETDGHRTNP